MGKASFLALVAMLRREDRAAVVASAQPLSQRLGLFWFSGELR